MISTTTQFTSQAPEQVNMFIVAFLLFVGVRSEWVEISQNYNRQEPFRLKQKNSLDHVTEVNIRYKNQTLPPQWKRGTVNKVSKVANVIRVPYASVKTPSIRPNLDKFMDARPSESQIMNRFETVRVSNKRPHFIEEDKMQRIQDTYKNSTITENDGLHGGSNTYFNVGNAVTAVTPRFDSDVTELQYAQVPVTMEQLLEINQSLRKDNINTIYPGNVLNEQMSSIRKQIYEDKNPKKFKVNIDHTHSSRKKLTNTMQKEHYVDDVNEKIEDNIISEENKMEGVWKALRIIAEIISKHTRRSFKSKVRYLEDLKQNIIASIEDHVDTIWPDDGVPHRRSRSAQARGHVEVPSSEGALMTISFLTFAVFLIKLVLQVIHTYKQKTMMVSPAVLAAVGRATAGSKHNHH